jgi:hypothetical protein
MKKALIISIIFLSVNLTYANTPLIRTCKLSAENRKSWADLKARGNNENQIRNEIFKKNLQNRKGADKEMQNLADQIMEEEIDFLIWMFDKKNIKLSPDQIYSIKFNECYKDLREKGY